MYTTVDGQHTAEFLTILLKAVYLRICPRELRIRYIETWVKIFALEVFKIKKSIVECIFNIDALQYRDKRYQVNRIFIGLKIITKAIGSYEYSDITGDYKCENALFLEKSNSKNNMIVPFTKNSQKGN